MKITKAGIKIIEETDPVKGETYEDCVGFALGELRENMNKIAETIDAIIDRLDAMKGGG